jgi:hypothetical protein
LANFGQVTFTGAWAETGPTLSHGATIGSITTFPGAFAVDMVTSPANPFTVPATISLTGGASTSNTLGFNEPTAGVSSSSFTVTWEPANGLVPPAASALSPATAGSSSLGSTAVVDAVFAQDALDNRLGSSAGVDALFALDALGNHHRKELLW